jgi:flagellar basal body-associated protein FliL
MQHEEQLPKKGFGTNTNGLGILIVVAVAVILALFCWNFWKDGSKATDHYRFSTMPTHSAEGDIEQGEKPGVTPSSAASESVDPAVTVNTGSERDTVSKAAAMDSAIQHADSTKH